jgi:hypothetical protein
LVVEFFHLCSCSHRYVVLYRVASTTRQEKSSGSGRVRSWWTAALRRISRGVGSWPLQISCCTRLPSEQALFRQQATYLVRGKTNAPQKSAHGCKKRRHGCVKSVG